jgi:hypothetical protein
MLPRVLAKTDSNLLKYSHSYFLTEGMVLRTSRNQWLGSTINLIDKDIIFKHKTMPHELKVLAQLWQDLTGIRVPSVQRAKEIEIHQTLV